MAQSGWLNNDCFFLHLHRFFWHPHTQHENTFLAFLCHPNKIASGLCNPYMHLKETSVLCNLEVNYEFKKTSGLHNPEYYWGVFLEIWKYMEVGEEYMEVQEETALNNWRWRWTVTFQIFNILFLSILWFLMN